MAKASPIQTNFTAGELSPRIEGRTDIAKYDNGAKTLENFVVHPQGGATRRPGTKFITEVADSSKTHRLLPFEFNVEQTYAVELGDQTARFITNDGILAKPETIAYLQSIRPDVGWGINDNDQQVLWSDDGLIAYFILYTEEKTGSTHTMEIGFKRYDCKEPYNILGATLERTNTLTLDDCHSSNIADGQRRFHTGVFFGNQAGSTTTGDALYVYDGIPTADPTVLSTSHTDFRIYQFNLVEPFVVIGANGAIASTANAVYSFGSNRSTSRYPMPVSGVDIVPFFSGLGSSPDQVYAYTDTKSATAYATWTKDGKVVFIKPSHLASNGSGDYFAGETIRESLLYIELSNSYDLSAAAVGYFPSPNTTTRVEVSGWTSAEATNYYFTGLQIRHTRNQIFMKGQTTQDASDPTWAADSEGHNWSVGPTVYTRNVDATKALGGLNVNDEYANVGFVIYLGAINTGAGDQPDEQRLFALNTHISSMSLDTSYGTLYACSDLVFSDATAHPDPSVASNQLTGFKPFVSYDGRRVFWSDQQADLTDDTELYSEATMRYPFVFWSFPTTTLHNERGVHPISNTSDFAGDNDRNDYAFIARALSVTTPYTSDQALAVRYAQSADVLFMVHPDVPPQQLVRYGASIWACEEVSFTRGPFLDPQFDGTTVKSVSAGATGQVITASDGIFTPSDVGRFIKLHTGYGKIETFGNEKSVFVRNVPNEDNRRELGPAYFASTIRFYEGDPSSTGLEHNDRITDSDGNFISQGFKANMRVAITGASNAANNQAEMLIVEVTDDTIIFAPSVDLVAEAAGSGVSIKEAFQDDDEFQLGAFSETTGYPSVVAIYEQRLVLGNTTSQPQTLYFSSQGAYTDFTPGLEATDAMTYTLGSEKANVIEYMSAARLLVVGTSGGEFVVSSGGVSEVLSPTNIQIRRQSNYGSANVVPLVVGSAVLFVQRAGRKVRELVYNFDTDSYYAPDLTLLAEHVTEGLISDVAWQQEPDSVMWCMLQDGTLAAMTYRREEEVIAWHRHTIGGSGFVESIITLPGSDNQDEVFFIVRRTIDGTTRRYVERLTEIDAVAATEDSWFLDSALLYSGVATSTITGLNHLEGETVSVLADGATHPDVTVSNGSVSLNVSAEKVLIGYGYSSTIQTMRIDAGGTEGTSQGKTKRVRGVTARFYRAVGAKIGPDVDNLKDIPFRKTGMAMDTAIPLYTGDKSIEFSGNYDTDGFVVIQQSDPLPMTVLALMPLVQTFDR